MIKSNKKSTIIKSVRFEKVALREWNSSLKGATVSSEKLLKDFNIKIKPRKGFF